MPEPTAPSAARNRFIELLCDFETGMLVTHGSDGGLHARPMAVARCDDDGTLLFATSSHSAKAEEIRDSPEATATFQGSGRFVTLTGHARLIEDRALVERLWSPAWRIWFPEGPTDPSLCILELTGHRGELWDRTGPNAVSFLWEASKALLRGRRADGEAAGHERVRL
jgi:general stress protein 26